MDTATMSTEARERQGAVTFKGNPLTLIGPELKAGAKAPDFQVLAQDLAPVALGQFKGKTLLISVVPSLDTPVCDAQTRRFNEEAARLAGVEILTVSMDLPFAQKRWCGAAGIDRVQVVSDHRDGSFGRAYGTLLKELRLLTRSIFLVDGGGTIRYVEYVPEVASHPNYDAALAAARQATTNNFSSSKNLKGDQVAG
jgi:thiol peroxidase